MILTLLQYFQSPGFTKRIVTSSEGSTIQPKVISDGSSYDGPIRNIQSGVPRNPMPTPRMSYAEVVQDSNSNTNRAAHVHDTNKHRRPSGTTVATPVPIDEDWIHGRLRDKHGNIIEVRNKL